MSVEAIKKLLNSKVSIATLLTLCILSQNLSAQVPTPDKNLNRRFSIDLGLGIPVTFFSVPSDLTGIYMGGLRYSLSDQFSISGSFQSNVFIGHIDNPSANKLSSNPVSSKDILSYRNAIYGAHGYIHYNLHRLLGLANNPKNRFIPFVTAGGGLIFMKPSAVFVNASSYAETKFLADPFHDAEVGLGLRYFINPNLDLTLGFEYNFVETYWLDGVNADAKYDTYINNHIGI